MKLSSISMIAGRVIICLCVTITSILVIEKLAYILYTNYVAPNFEYFVPSTALVLPIAVWISTTVSFLIGYYAKLELGLTATGTVIGLSAYVLYGGRGDTDPFFAAVRWLYEGAFGLEYIPSFVIWIALVILAGLGLVTSRGLYVSSGSSIRRFIPAIATTLIIGVVLLVIVWIPLSRAEMSEIKHLSARIQELASTANTKHHVPLSLPCPSAQEVPPKQQSSRH